ncbi:MAG: hypothetical protein JSV24_04690 [Bacteroidales bacterium]|nr:MAG: hypothetical protein JSV24_04690 [Bacteroidales bacterium]
MPLSHRERVQTALDHTVPDRCPMQISYTPEFASRLISHLKKKYPESFNKDTGKNIYELERILDQDMLLTSPAWNNAYHQIYQPGEEFKDEWGIGWKAVPYDTKFGTGVYTEMIYHPLASDHVILSYQPPDPNPKELYEETARVLEKFKDEYWIVGVTVTTIFEKAWALRGYEQIMIDMLINPELVDRLFDIPYTYHLKMAERLVRMGVDMIWIGDDVGSQSSMLISPEHWKRFMKDKMAAFIQDLKNINPEIKIAYHSDGNISPIIPDLVEIGLDVLNPVQPGCMDPLRLKKEFGDKLCFWGSIDEQYTLPFGSPEDVMNEVFERIETLGKNGGLIIGPAHHVQLDTPMENFLAMVNAIRESYSGSRKRGDGLY